MEAYELYIEPERVTIDSATGRFLPGHRPANTGKKWSEYMTEEKQKNCAKGWENLRKYGAHPKSPDAGRNPRAVVALYPDGKYNCYESIAEAARQLGYIPMNIRRCCNSNESQQVLRSLSPKKRGTVNTDHQYNGIRFYFRHGEVWWGKVGSKL